VGPLPHAPTLKTATPHSSPPATPAPSLTTTDTPDPYPAASGHTPREAPCHPPTGQGLLGVFVEAGAVAVLVVGDHGVVQVDGSPMPRRASQGISRLLRRARRAFSWSWRSTGFFFRLLPLVVMPLDGEEHAGAEHGHLENNEDYRDPIHLGDFPGC